MNEAPGKPCDEGTEVRPRLSHSVRVEDFFFKSVIEIISAISGLQKEAKGEKSVS